jgi:hypothetical protein
MGFSALWLTDARTLAPGHKKGSVVDARSLCRSQLAGDLDCASDFRLPDAMVYGASIASKLAPTDLHSYRY